MNGPEDKPLRAMSFIAHMTRGLIRDRRTRRAAMTLVVCGALSMVLAGSTFLSGWLAPGEHLFRFLLFWFVCAWLTLLSLLLALFDLLMVRAETRRQARGLQKRFSVSENVPEPRDE